MKFKYISLCMLLAFIFIACNDDEPATVTFPKDVETTFDPVGEYREIALQAVGEWSAVSHADWCKVVRSAGVGNGALVLNVLGNLTNEKRTAQVEVTSNGTTSYLEITQDALPEGAKLKYRLPIVFHVLYFDEDDRNQNPSAETLYSVLDKANLIYKEACRNSAGLEVEFYPAPYNPKGQKLEEPGIDRVQWISPTLDAQEVMHNTKREYVHFMWEPNDYTNVLLYNFSDNTLLGISTFPVMPMAYQQPGFDLVGDYDYSMDNLVSFRGVSINAHYLYESNDIFYDYVPADMKELVNMQNAPHITLAHELGHYLGLRHIFSEDFWCHSTDYCEDTEAYDYKKYTEEILNLYTGILSGSVNPAEMDWNSIFTRLNCGKQPFESHNVMDYAYSYLDEFSVGQCDRMRHVLEHSPLIPGGKVKFAETKAVPADMEPLPLRVSEGKPACIIPVK